jgi:Fe-S-cluster-containing hydrogenase component 2/CRP-like cAMP-binding protein
MAKAELTVNPQAELESRDFDLELDEETYLKISLFSQLKQKPSLKKFPGALRLRHYQKGDLICQQGEAGWTAFYVLTAEDIRAIGKGPGELAVKNQGPVPATSDSVIATVYLVLAQSKARPRGILERLASRLFGARATPAGRRPSSIPIDGPRDLDSNTLETSLHEGELFGEMSCMYRTPRSATVVAARECYVLEMLRNILDQLQKDKAYKERTEEIYKKRVLEMHLRKLAIFQHLQDEEYGRIYSEIRDQLELKSYEAGEVICYENDISDSLYIIRNGLVKTIKGTSPLLAPADVFDWGKVLTLLQEAKPDPSKPAAMIWKFLNETVKSAIENAAPPRQALNESQHPIVLQGLNDVIKNKSFSSSKELQALAKTVGQDHAREPIKLNRVLLEALLPGCLRTYRSTSGQELVLSYSGRGEFIGEMGLMANEPRSATCEAYAHPSGAGRAELVKVPAQVFRKIIDSCDGARRVVEAAVAARKQRTKRVTQEPAQSGEASPLFSPRFQELGLIQGQRLMLIDLDRCTRCDECVKACVNTHDDGRTRLFLDGPRYGQYLIPTTCRSCLDPVCLIGCPVGSIHRDDQQQIVVEDWCIGCGLCAKQCPYGSIQMHDIGIIAEGARDWRYFPANVMSADGWQQPGFRDRTWPAARAPFYWDRAFQQTLAGLGKTASREAGPQAILFRKYFWIEKNRFDVSGPFRFKVTTTDPAPAIWLNGHPLVPDGKPKQSAVEYSLLPKEPNTSGDPRQILKKGRNVVAVRIAIESSSPKVLFDLRLDEIHQPDGAKESDEQVVEKLVTERAVVCDLCSTLSGGPACVSACPHDAAMRVDGRLNFPMKAS